jgi:L-ascorbate metabolism protein UlaG (beta-lactamase superfamily)
MGNAFNEKQVQGNDSQLNHHKDDGYQNTAPGFKNETPILPILWRAITEKRKDSVPVQRVPIKPLTLEQLNQLPADTDSVIRLGHSTIYLQLNGQKWLIDPMFSERASPFSFVGPKRFHHTPIALQDLPIIDGVIISHDHYDHLDEKSIKALASKTSVFIVPLGVNSHLKKWGIPPEHIKSLDWWQSLSFNSIRITATPTQHFSGRWLFDKDETLWASYVIESPKSKIYFSGDSGYFAGFKEIGDKFGPFDLTMIETGAYDKDWSTIHMLPEESVQAHIDLKGKHLMPIHNGTFDLAFHAWYDPLVRINKLTNEKSIPLVTPIMGQIININNIEETPNWWEN